MQGRKRVVLIAILIAVLVLGIGIGAGGSLLFSGRLIANALLELKTLELYRSYDAATDASRSQLPETAIWALERHLELIDEFKRIDYPPRSLDIQAIIVHARLVRLYGALNKMDKKRTHVHLALDAAKSSGSSALQKITSEEGLAVFLKGVDDPSQRDASFWEQNGSGKEANKGGRTL